MRRGLQWLIVLGIALLGAVALRAWFDAEAPSDASSAPADSSRAAMADPAVAPREGSGRGTNTDPQAVARVSERPSGPDLDAQALQLPTPYLRDCGSSTFAVQGGYGNTMYEFRALTRTVNRLGVSPAESLEHVDWTGSVSLAWEDERKRCLDCEEQWLDWTGAGSVLMEARHKNGAWKANAPNSTFIQLQPAWTCEWFQRPAAAPMITETPAASTEN